MTEPTRDALHTETLDYLTGQSQFWEGRGSELLRKEYAYAAECVKRVAELEAEVERLRADLDDSLAQQGDIVGRLTAELDAINAAAADFYAEDASNLRAHPDIPWGIGGKSGSEHVAEWRNDLAERIERLLAAYAAATREGTDAG